MGIIRCVSKFEHPAPRPCEIAAIVRSISGLDVAYSDEEADDCQDYEAHFYFEAFPHNRVEIYTYKQGEVREWVREDGDEAEDIGKPWHIPVEGYDDIDGVQRIYSQCYFGQEPTLFVIIDVALKRLGGISDSELGDLEEYDKKISEEELQSRHTKWAEEMKKQKPREFLHAFICMVCIPFQIIWMVLSMPYTIFKLYRSHPEIFRDND